MPQRRRALPPELSDIFAGVDLILHAGDVGELWVFDQLAALAPVVAVHGNDDTAEAQRELPYRQLVSVGGVRILLWHSHYPDWHEEMASRRDDELPPKLERSILFGRRAGAQAVVFGHWHIPLVHRTDDVLLVNPGALAAGNVYSATRYYTVALLYIDDMAGVHAVHVDIARPREPFRPNVDLSAGFAAALDRFSRPIVTPALDEALRFAGQRLKRDEITALIPVFVELAWPLWDGGDGQMTLDAVYDHLRRTRDVAPALADRVIALLDEWRVRRAAAQT
jgi:putative phosphoesterase